MSNQALKDAHRALGIANALKVAVAVMASSHPDRVALRDDLSRLYSSMADPQAPLSGSIDARAGWDEVVALLQHSLGGFPVIAKPDPNAE